MDNSRDDAGLLGRMLADASTLRRRFAEDNPPAARVPAAAPPRASSPRQHDHAPGRAPQPGPWGDDDATTMAAAPRTAQPGVRRAPARTRLRRHDEADPPYETPVHRRSTTLAPPIPRTWMDAILPLTRLGIGAAFIAYSGYATVRHMAGDLEGVIPALDVRYLLTALVAAAIMIIEALTSERVKWLYWPVLLFDVYYTWRDLSLWVPQLVDMFPMAFLVLPAFAGWMQIHIERLHRGYAIALLALIVGGLWAVQTFSGQVMSTLFPVNGALWTAGGMGAITAVITMYLGFVIARSGEIAILGVRRQHLT